MNAAFAFEGKWTEPRYDDVESWLKQGDPEHRRHVLAAWLGRIARFTATPPATDACSKLVYQAVHRTASACSGTCRSAAVVYQCFSDKDHEHAQVADDLRELARVLGLSPHLTFYVQGIPLSPRPAYRELARRCENYTPRQRASAIRLALWDDDLFEFGSPVLERIAL